MIDHHPALEAFNSSMEEACYDQDTSTQDWYHEDEVMDTLSLSDLLIYDNNGDPQDFYQVDANHDTDDQFEFSSELLKTTASSSVVFCGKIIPYKEPTGVSLNTHKQESKKQHKRDTRRWRLFPFFKKSSRPDKSNLDLKYDQVPVRRVSILATATKPRWYFFMSGFGSSRFQVKMHIRDLKKRQTSMAMGTKSSGGDNKISDGNGGGIGPWKLVRLLGCGGGGGVHHHPNAIAKSKSELGQQVGV